MRIANVLLFSEAHYDLLVGSRHEIIIDKDEWHSECGLYNVRICNIERLIRGAYHDSSSARHHGAFSGFSGSETR